MRRGLMGRDEAELPVSALHARLAGLRAAMAKSGLDAFVLYTNNVRPSAVTWATGFTPYWSDALLLIGKDGAPTFATALSKRVSEWIRTTDPVSDIANTPKPGTLIGERIAKSGVKRVGVLEFDTLPAGLADDIATTAPDVEWTDGTALFATLRGAPDEAERKLLTRADAIATAALNEAGGAKDAGSLAGMIEKSARLAGAEEVYVAIAPDLAADRRLNRTSQPAPLAQCYAVRASVAYKGAWVRRVRTLGGPADADAWFTHATSSLQAGQPLGAQLAALLRQLPGATLTGWLAEGCTGSYPLSALASSRLPAPFAPGNGQFLVLTVELSVNGAPWIGAAPLIVGREKL